MEVHTVLTAHLSGGLDSIPDTNAELLILTR